MTTIITVRKKTHLDSQIVIHDHSSHYHVAHICSSSLPSSTSKKARLGFQTHHSPSPPNDTSWSADYRRYLDSGSLHHLLEVYMFDIWLCYTQQSMRNGTIRSTDSS